MRELSVGTLDRHLRGIADTHGVATARMCRSVLSGMCTLSATTPSPSTRYAPWDR